MTPSSVCNAWLQTSVVSQSLITEMEHSQELCSQTGILCREAVEVVMKLPKATKHVGEMPSDGHA